MAMLRHTQFVTLKRNKLFYRRLSSCLPSRPRKRRVGALAGLESAWLGGRGEQELSSEKTRVVGLEEDESTVVVCLEEDESTVDVGLEEDKGKFRDVGLKGDHSTVRKESGLVLRLQRLALRLQYREDTNQSCNKHYLLYFPNKYYSILL
jgi:hypothetical protein